MRIWSWTVDDWNAAFQGFAILCIAGTLLAGAGKFWTDKIIKQRGAQELAAAKERTANAENELVKLKERTRPRGFTETELQDVRGRLQTISEKIPVEIVLLEHRFPATETSDLIGEQLGKVFRESGFELSLKRVPKAKGIGIHLRLLFKEALTTPPSLEPLGHVFDGCRVLWTFGTEVDPAYQRLTLRIEISDEPLSRS